MATRELEALLKSVWVADGPGVSGPVGTRGAAGLAPEVKGLWVDGLASPPSNQSELSDQDGGCRTSTAIPEPQHRTGEAALASGIHIPEDRRGCATHEVEDGLRGGVEPLGVAQGPGGSFGGR